MDNGSLPGIVHVLADADDEDDDIDNHEGRDKGESHRVLVQTENIILSSSKAWVDAGPRLNIRKDVFS